MICVTSKLQKQSQDSPLVALQNSTKCWWYNNIYCCLKFRKSVLFSKQMYYVAMWGSQEYSFIHVCIADWDFQLAPELQQWKVLSVDQIKGNNFYLCMFWLDGLVIWSIYSRWWNISKRCRNVSQVGLQRTTCYCRGFSVVWPKHALHWSTENPLLL